MPGSMYLQTGIYANKKPPVINATAQPVAASETQPVTQQTVAEKPKTFNQKSTEETGYRQNPGDAYGSTMGTNIYGSVKPKSAGLVDMKTDYNYDKDIKKEDNAGETVSAKNTSSVSNNSYSNGGQFNLDNLKGFLGNIVGTNQPQQNAPATPVQPDTTVQDNYKVAMEAANDRLKQAYEYQQGLLATAKDNALREAYIKQQMVERGYPEQLSAAGINGGAAQGLIARNNANYANQRSAIQGDYLNNLGEAGFNYQQSVAKNNEDFLNRMAAYQQSLDEMRRKWELEQLEKSGLLNVPTTVKNPVSGLEGLFGGTVTQKLTPQEYLNSLRANYGNLFK